MKRIYSPGYSTGATFGRTDGELFTLSYKLAIYPALARDGSISSAISTSSHSSAAAKRRVASVPFRQRPLRQPSFRPLCQKRCNISPLRKAFMSGSTFDSKLQTPEIVFAHERAPRQNSYTRKISSRIRPKFPSAAAVMRTIAHIRLKEQHAYSTLPLHFQIADDSKPRMSIRSQQVASLVSVAVIVVNLTDTCKLE